MVQAIAPLQAGILGELRRTPMLTWYKRSRPYKPVSWVNSGELPSRFIQFNTFFLSQPLL
ncbi:hypothetical protein [Coleofasciculus sp. FACHB-542]|uniref:hypothetical protein n=1 Tax=Coleofasciculus sp. FACHB-542 TaxID=2692787 RepID=UPI0016876FBA|nr:hypothetical protein [Coleofasciculus sp. FACHB-542]MBD2087676.1 hypothetical protein [Coleofasciculus sp. FACHB-542]